MEIGRFLVTLGLVIALIGLLWPWLGKIGFGRLPGDVIIVRERSRFYFPVTSGLLISIIVSLVLWLFRR